MDKDLILSAKFFPLSMKEPDAWIGHAPFAFWLVSKVKPKIFVELGTHTGNSYFSFCQSIDQLNIPVKCYAVDSWVGDLHSGAYDDSVFLELNEYNKRNYGSFSALLRMNFDDARPCFADESISVLHIDGFHTYEAVRHDFDTWLPKLAPGAIVLLHDTNVKGRDFGVWRFWEELKTRFSAHIEFVHSNGLGVIQLDGGNTLPQFKTDFADRQLFVDYFATLGSHQSRFFELHRCEKEIVALRDVDRQREEQNHVLQLGVAERDQKIIDLHHIVDDRDREILVLHSHIQDRDVELARVSEDILQMKKKQSALNESLQQCASELDEKKKEISIILNSNSWRLSKPFRFIRRSYSTGLHGLIVFVRNCFYSCRAVMVKYGFRGFFVRLPYYLKNYRKVFPLLFNDSLAISGSEFSCSSTFVSPSQLSPDLGGDFRLLSESVSVVIPTLNAGPEFHSLLKKLQCQNAIGGLEIIVVDSGSTDQTVAFAREAGCIVCEISPEQFSHSYARNLGAKQAHHEYLLFMVQDAYPIGDYWLYGLLLSLKSNSDWNIVALSCAEYGRSDSDLMYDSMIETHYRFLGCGTCDRIGEYLADNHMSLRSQGQLSDVACLIRRDIFEQYQYRGDYAEDLDLGIRLIRDGYRVAMLSSLRVIHSHNRPAFYYLKRSYVDVVFLAQMFDDFICPSVMSFHGLVAGIVSTAIYISEEFSNSVNSPQGNISVLISQKICDWRKRFLTFKHGKLISLGDYKLDSYLQGLSDRFLIDQDNVDCMAKKQARQFVESYLARLEHFNLFAKEVYDGVDEFLWQDVKAVFLKSFSAAVGASLAYFYLEAVRNKGEDIEAALSIHQELKAGI